LKEGIDLSHCVAGYSAYCFAGNSRIFSLLDKETGERATLEVRQRNTEEKWVAVKRQLFGHGNKEPSPQFHTAANSFIDMLNKDVSATVWPRLETPSQWKSQETGPDSIFFDQVRAWLNAKHKALCTRLDEDFSQHQVEARARAEARAAGSLPTPNFQSLAERRQNQRFEQTLRIPAQNAHRPGAT